MCGRTYRPHDSMCVCSCSEAGGVRMRVCERACAEAPTGTLHGRVCECSYSLATVCACVQHAAHNTLKACMSALAVRQVVCACVCTHALLGLALRVCVCVCVCVCARAHVHMSMDVFVCVLKCMCMRACECACAEAPTGTLHGRVCECSCSSAAVCACVWPRKHKQPSRSTHCLCTPGLASLHSPASSAAPNALAQERNEPSQRGQTKLRKASCVIDYGLSGWAKSAPRVICCIWVHIFWRPTIILHFELSTYAAIL